MSQFDFKFNMFSESEALSHFRFKTADVIRMINVVEMHSGKTKMLCTEVAAITPGQSTRVRNAVCTGDHQVVTGNESGRDRRK